ncbi:MAG: cation transporter [Bacteroidetes bacterium]|nr:MAG: cation transporter [Bacteroidota bacterium]
MPDSPTSRPLIRLQRLILIAGTLIFLVKILAWYLTDSNAILTDAAESVINVLAGAFALYSLYVAARPRDHNHPYGHGKIEYLSSGLEGILILLAGTIMSGKAIYGFFVPHPITHLDQGIWLTLIGGGINGLMGAYLLRKARRHRSQILRAEGRHLLSDAWSSLGLIIGLGLITLTGLVWLDNLIAIVFGLLIGYAGLRIIRTALAGVMDEADLPLIEDITRILAAGRQPHWIDLHNLRVIRYGAATHIDCHLTLPWYLNLHDSHQAVKDVEALLARELPGRVECFIHADPCRPPSCSVCSLTGCPQRQHPFRGERVSWTVDSLQQRQQHVLPEG